MQDCAAFIGSRQDRRQPQLTSRESGDRTSAMEVEMVKAILGSDIRWALAMLLCVGPIFGFLILYFAYRSIPALIRATKEMIEAMNVLKSTVEILKKDIEMHDKRLAVMERANGKRQHYKSY